VGVEELLAAGDVLEAAEAAATVQVVVGEAAAHQLGHGDLSQFRGQRLPPLVPQRMSVLLHGEPVTLADLAQGQGPQLSETNLADAARAG
jgi:hypothetical protein